MGARAAAVLVVLAVVGGVVGCGAATPGAEPTRPAGPTSTGGPSVPPLQTSGSAASSPEPPSVGRSPATIAPAQPVVAPVRMTVADVGIDALVQPVGVRPDGQMDLPADPDVIGWYRFGPSTTATAGSAVLGGHLDSTVYGVGQLARLRDVSVGAVIVVTAEDQTVTRYRVTDVQRVPKASLPVAELFRRDGARALVVVTCGGAYLPDRGGYQENLVVTAAPA